MSKSILISIKPEWVAKILNGEKTIEVRKTLPKCDLPIDVYIYCTKDLKSGKKVLTWLNEKGLSKVKTITYLGNDILGKVVAKFTLNKAEEIKFNDKKIQEKSCLSEDKLFDYLFDNSPYQEDMRKGYAWNIDNLVIFDKPNELSEFKRCTEKTCIYGKCHKYMHCLKTLNKAPQSWCYIETEELK